jgi:Sec-independent protein translocase protein TatA
MNLVAVLLALSPVIVIFLFGVGRLSKIGGELGKAIHDFRTALKPSDEKTKEEEK